MPGQPSPAFLGGRTRADRVRRRAGTRLRDFSITAKTRARYDLAVGRILPYVHHLDEVISDWIEWQWARGESVGTISDALSGLHFYWPEVRGPLRGAWRLFRQWRIAIGFHGLLRTGELMALRFGDIEFNRRCGVVSLNQSKTGLRTGSKEAIAVRDSLTLLLLETLVSLRHPCAGDPLWPHSAQAFRTAFRALCDFFRVEGLNFEPYSLRRRGATYLLQVGTPLKTILVRGRWRSLQSGKTIFGGWAGSIAFSPEFIFTTASFTGMEPKKTLQQPFGHNSHGSWKSPRLCWQCRTCKGGEAKVKQERPFHTIWIWPYHKLSSHSHTNWHVEAVLNHQPYQLAVCTKVFRSLSFQMETN